MALLAISAFPDEKSAREAAAALVRKRLAACASVLPPMHSTYRWKGKVCGQNEALLLAKTTDAAYPALEEELRAAHPYELPEIIALKIARGSKAYLAWLGASCSKNLKTSSRLKKQALFKGR